MNTLKINDNPLELAEKILADLKSSEGMGLLKCVQCGMCTSTCPAAKNSNYNPREMIEKVLEGDRSVIDDENIWKCFYCYTCHSICPVGNSACEVNQVLRQIAIGKGIANDKISPFSEFGDTMLNFGLGGIPSNFFDEMDNDIGKKWAELRENVNDIRKDLGLKPLKMPKESIKEIKALLERTGFDNRIKKIKKGSE